MDVGRNQNINAVNSLQPDQPAAASSAAGQTAYVPVNTVQNISLLPAAVPPTSQAAYYQPTINPLRYTFQTMPAAHLLSFDLPSPPSEYQQSSAVSSTLQRYPVPSAAVQPRLSAPARPAVDEFYQRIQAVLNQNRQKKKPSLLSRAGTLINRTLLKLSLTANKSDNPELTLSSGTVTPATVASLSDSMQISPRKQPRQSAAFTAFFYTGVNISDNDKYKLLDIKAQRFESVFSGKVFQAMIRLCHNWHTLDLESVIIVYESITAIMPMQSIETISSDDVLFHCFVKKELVDPEKPVLTNMQYDEIISETEVEPHRGNVQTGNWHRAVLSGESKGDFKIIPQYRYLSTIKHEGIVFRIVVKDTPYLTLHNNPDTIEVSCTLTDLLLAKAIIGRHLNTEFKNRVFVRLPPGATINCNIVEKESDNSANRSDENA